MDANPSGHAKRPESQSTGPPDRGVGRRRRRRRLAREGAAGPFQRQRWLAAANPSKWLRPAVTTTIHAAAAQPVTFTIHAAAQTHPSPPEPNPAGLGSAGPGSVGLTLGLNARAFGAARLCRAVGARAGAAAWIVRLTASAAAAGIVIVTAGLSHFDGFAATNQRCLQRGTCASPLVQVSSFLVVALTPLCSDSRVVWHAHLGLHPLRNLAGFTGFVRNNNTWLPSKTVHVFARSCLLMSPCGEASDVATPSTV